VVAALGGPRSAPPTRVFPVVALATFVVQEHLERLVHGGVPLLLTSPAFLVGLVLQLPVALVAWGLARWLLRAVGEQRTPTRLRSRLQLGLVHLPQDHLAAVALPRAASRGPPAPLSPC
jgi:hypothetical protein